MEKRMSGNMVRSRALTENEWEKPSKYFLNLEKKNFLDRRIPALILDDGSETTDSYIT